jgi:hypothetical protein
MSQYTYNAEAYGVNLELLINGLPVFLSPPEGGSRSGRINHWIIDGINRVEVRSSFTAVTENQLSQLSAEVSIADDARPVWAYHWTLPEPPGPAVVRHEFVSTARFGTWAWQTAPQTLLDPAAAQAIQREVTALAIAIQSGDTATTAALLRLKTEDMARAYGLPLSMLLTDQQSFFADLTRQPQWGLAPFEGRDLRFTAWADGRVIRVERTDGTAVIRSARYSLDLMYAFVNGRWRVIR